ncbi:hypothetical protein DMUE_1690 [Dictyocoela muelleri]|nr:hypothetical protein DMUE_1690 [Dictyocoela muelleri]
MVATKNVIKIIIYFSLFLGIILLISFYTIQKIKASKEKSDMNDNAREEFYTSDNFQEIFKDFYEKNKFNFSNNPNLQNMNNPNLQNMNNPNLQNMNFNGFDFSQMQNIFEENNIHQLIGFLSQFENLKDIYPDIWNYINTFIPEFEERMKNDSIKSK